MEEPLNARWRVPPVVRWVREPEGTSLGDKIVLVAGGEKGKK